MSDSATARLAGTSPAGVRRLPRTHLVERLDELFAVRAGLVSGPAGSGKTTLVRAWAEQTHSAVVAYLHTRPEHRDARVLSADILESLRATGVVEGHTQAPDRTGLTDIATSGKRIVLIIDEVEALQGAGSSSVIDDLISNGGTSLRVVAVGRAVDHLVLDELRRNDELLEVTAADLRLTQQETLHLVCSISGISTADEVMAGVHDQTDGWVAGAVLAGLVLREAGASDAVVSDLVGSHHFDRFLDQHLFTDLPEDIRQFLLDTCVLDPLIADQCAALSGRDDADRILHWLERHHVFTEWIGGTPRTFRYHPLLRSWLVGRLPDARARELFRCASAWSSEQGRHAEAIEYLLDAHETDAAIGAILGYASQALAEGRYEALTTWIGAIPSSNLASNVGLLSLGLELSKRVGGDDGPSFARMLSLQTLANGTSDRAGEARTRLTIEAQHIRELCLEGRLIESGTHARQALADFDMIGFQPEQPELTLEDLAVATNVNVCTTQLMFAGHLSESIEASQWVLDTFAGPHPVQAATAANATGRIALCELLRHQREPALRRAREAVALCRFHRIDPVDLGWAEGVLAVAGTEVERSNAVAAIDRRLRRTRFPAFVQLGRLLRAWSDVLAHDPLSARLDLARAERAIASMPEPAMLAMLLPRVARIVERNADEPVLLGRQRAVLASLAVGRSRREAADELHLSVNTVKTYARLAYRSLGAASLDEAIEICADLGISLDPVDSDAPTGSVGAAPAN